jgi:hypothetical protein
MTTTFVDARVGDKVWCFVYGWGVVIKVKILTSHPIHVRFKKENVCAYTVRGELFTDGRQVLFWDEVKVIAPKKQPNTKYKNVNGFKVLNLPVELPPEPEMIHIRVPRFSTVPGSALLCVSSDNEGLWRLTQHGIAYPWTPEGEDAAAAHAWALLGEGEPWNDQE